MQSTVPKTDPDTPPHIAQPEINPVCEGNTLLRHARSLDTIGPNVEAMRVIFDIPGPIAKAEDFCDFFVTEH